MAKLAVEQTPEKVELGQHNVALNIGSEIERIASNLDSSKSAANKLLVSAKELSSNIGRELYRAQVNISSDFKTLQKVDNELRSSYKELKGYNNDIDKLFDKVEQAEKSLGRSTDIDRLYNCLLYTSPSPRDKRQSRMPSSA